MKAAIFLNGVELPFKRRWTPKVRRIVRRLTHSRGKWRGHKLHPLIVCGIIGAATLAQFTPILRIYTNGSGATETIPPGPTFVTIESWASGGGGGGGSGSGCGAGGGGGGGGGGNSRIKLNIVLQWNNTFTYTVGQSVAGQTNGQNSTITAGTVTGFNTITCNGGNKGANANLGTGGTGGTVVNTNAGAVNTAGNNGLNGGLGNPGGAGAVGIAGIVSGDGSPYGAGGLGGNNSGQPGGASQTGAIVFYYTSV